MKNFIAILFLLAGCAGQSRVGPDGFLFVPIKSGAYEIATWQKITNPNDLLIHIYIEGDGYAFDAYGQPTDDPTPRGDFVRDLVAQDNASNVVYVARPCQFIIGEYCKQSDWTNGRFAEKIIDAESGVIKKISGGKKITLVGYSGGAMVSGLVIKQNPDLKIEKWITIAGVLDHKKWTEYFGDEPLMDSQNLEKLPDVPQVHFVGEYDKIVPYELALNWAKNSDIKVVKNATHNNFRDLKIFD